jgi:hypothetical protein
MPDDEVMRELRAIRAQIAAECDYDFHKLVEWAQQVEKTWPAKVVTKEELRACREAAAPVPEPER